MYCKYNTECLNVVFVILCLLSEYIHNNLTLVMSADFNFKITFF